MQTMPESANYRFDFLKYRYVFLGVSALYLLVGIAAYVMKDGFRYHIDFTGGAELRISFDKPTDIAKIRSVISDAGWKESVIQSVGTANKEFIIVVSHLDENGETRLKANLDKGIEGNKVTVNNVQLVGAEAGKDTTKNAILAVVFAMIVLLLYIAVRFEFRFGIGAVACLMHDVLAVMVFLLITGEQMSLHILASIMAVLGYSLNDTIVVFSRIRENFKKLKGMSEYDMVNISINQALKRTLLTSFATTLSVIAILLLGGETLRGLSLVMLVGIVVGTYSSIYIASPVMLAIKIRKKP